MASITDLPIEILLKIFQYYMQTRCQKTFLDNISTVCEAWRNICLDSSLWTKFDGTPTFNQMMYLSENGALRNTKELTLSSIGFTNCSKSAAKELKLKITSEVSTVGKTKKIKLSPFDYSKSLIDEPKLFQNIQNVEVISFSRVKQISCDMLSAVAKNCTKLREIQIGKKGKLLIDLDYSNFGDFFALRGFRIKKIDFSYCEMTLFSSWMLCISDCCPNLEYLYLMNIFCNNHCFPTGYVQSHCSKLKVLYLDGNIRIETSRDLPGFPDLEEFVYIDDKRLFLTDLPFRCLMFNSPKLKILRLTNCGVSASIMLSVPATSVEYLYIPLSKASCDETLGDILKKWSHSLKEVDLSYGNCYIQNAVLKLIKTPIESPLKFLNLSFTPIKLDLVEKIVKDCSHLETLNLKACRNVLRGMKKIYSGELEFQELTEKIRSYRSTHPPEVLTIRDL